MFYLRCINRLCEKSIISRFLPRTTLTLHSRQHNHHRRHFPVPKSKESASVKLTQPAAGKKSDRQSSNDDDECKSSSKLSACPPSQAPAECPSLDCPPECPPKGPPECPPMSPATSKGAGPTEPPDPKGGSEGAATGGGGDGPAAVPPLKRALKSGPCRLVFIPESYFLFFHPITGVTGGYLLLLGLANYCVSKEIYVMEHEYYGGLSWIVVITVIYQKFGKKIAAALDKQVDSVSNTFEESRKQQVDFQKDIIKGNELAKKRAKGQEKLMQAKKENVLMQLEAAYRERAMFVYQTVINRMNYHIKLYQTEARIHQEWMVKWILQNVEKALTPDFKQRILEQAIEELETVAASASKP